MLLDCRQVRIARVRLREPSAVISNCFVSVAVRVAGLRCTLTRMPSSDFSAADPREMERCFQAVLHQQAALRQLTSASCYFVRL